ncbi:interleukin-20 receptor subunit alpha isoform X2 [Electrophorus electricus]|uniref:interleukin-20 receptor subunit alpha isoform X2 n=1 Tax=Electrophorus electricus TaxID=8005 RepID=UPI0015D0507D|nr:interleukin-20 receptor subunit alpha isoform X2 [Electrophorus electricus]
MTAPRDGALSENLSEQEPEEEQEPSWKEEPLYARRESTDSTAGCRRFLTFTPAMISNLLVTALWLALQPPTAWAEGSVVAGPRDVHFHSVNLWNRLRWTRAQGSLSKSTTYTVEYALYGDAVEVGSSVQVVWNAVEQCTDITQMECDLTEQTHDMEEAYYGRVRVSGPNGSSDWTETDGRFRPMSETVLGPPQMEVTLRENYLRVLLKGPYRWRSGRTRGRQSLWSVFPHMVYNVSVYNNRSKHRHFFLLTNGSLTLGPLDFDTGVCVTAETHSLSRHLDSQPTLPACVHTPRDPFTTHMLVVILGGLVPATICLFVLAVAGGCVYYYIHSPPEKPPRSTDLVHVGETRQTFQPEKPLIISLRLVTASLGAGDPTLGFLETEHLLPVKARPLPAATPAPAVSVTGEARGGPYASQNATQASGGETEDATETASNGDSGPWCDGSFPDDSYGLVIGTLLQQDEQADGRAEDPSVRGVDLSILQSRAGEGGGEKCEGTEEEEEEEEGGLKLDWNPQTGVLKIPQVCPLGLEDLDASGAGEESPVLTSVVVRQCSEESREDDVFAEMEEVWGLQIQSSLE